MYLHAPFLTPSRASTGKVEIWQEKYIFYFTFPWVSDLKIILHVHCTMSYLPTALYNIDRKHSTSVASSARVKCTTWLSNIDCPNAFLFLVYSAVNFIKLAKGSIAVKRNIIPCSIRTVTTHRVIVKGRLQCEKKMILC